MSRGRLVLRLVVSTYDELLPSGSASLVLVSTSLKPHVSGEKATFRKRLTLRFVGSTDGELLLPVSASLLYVSASLAPLMLRFIKGQLTSRRGK